jgi:type III secretion protein C
VKPRFGRWSRGLLAAAMLGLAAPAAADGPPFPEKTVSLSARGQDVRDFIADLMGAAGLKVKVSTAVKGRVQGAFRDPPKEIWDTISRAYGLVAYWDGRVVRVYANGEIGSRSVPTDAPADVVAQVGQLKLADGVNTVRAADGLVLATGVPAFLDQVETMAGQLGTRMARAPSAPATIPQSAAVTQGETIASPLLRAPLARASLRSEVIQPAGKRSPFEVRIFFLTYRDAADREVRSADRATVIPGVATLLQEQMGDGRQVGGVTSNLANEYEISGLRALNRQAPFGSGTEAPRSEAEERAPDLDGPRISADPTINAVIVRDRPEMMSTYDLMIASLDVEPLMVETQITIMELNVTRLKELGIDFGFVLPSLGLGALFGGVPSVGPGGATGGFISGDGDAFLTRIRALEESGAVRVVTRPVLSTANNQVATFDITAQQVLRLQSERAVDALALNYGLAMRIRPSAIEDGGEMRIRMQVEVSDTSLNGVVVDGVPTSAGPRISTQMIVKQGESVMLAGMTRTATYDTKTKTPGLGDIPLLGQAFRKRRKGEDHIERLFLLTPRISNLGSTTVARSTQEPYTLDQLRGVAQREGLRR